MACYVTTTPAGNRTIVCTRGTRGAGRPRCSACLIGEPTVLCDFPTPRVPGTCDAWLCTGCAVPQRPVFGQPRVDWCPTHADLA